MHLLHCYFRDVKYKGMNKSNKQEHPTLAKSVRKTSVGWMIKSISTKLDENMIKALKPYGINLGQFGILMTLLEGDGLTQSEIGKKISMPGYATTRNIDILEQNGLLERQKNKVSRRSFCILLTEKGKSLAPTLFSIVKNINKSALSPLDEKEVLLLKQLLSKMLN